MAEPSPRVVHLTTVHHALDPRIFRKELGTLRAAGYDVCLVAQHDRAEVRDGVRLVPLPRLDRGSRQGGRLRRLALQRAAYRAARAQKAALYHFHDPELIPVAFLLQRHTGARVVYDMHEDYRAYGGVSGRLLRALERWCFTWADHVVTANASQVAISAPHVATTLVANHFLPMPEAPPPAPRPAPDGPWRVLYTGVVSQKRGVQHLLDLAAVLRANALPVTVEVAGVCPLAADRRGAEQRIAQEALQDRIVLNGWDRYLPWPDLARRYDQAQVGLVLWPPHPDHTHKVPTKFYEYLHHGLPILCSDFPLWRAFVERHGCGAVVPPGDAEAAAAVLAHWQARPDVYERLSMASARAAPRYQWAPMGARLVAVYEGLIGPAR